ncbi:bifunctional protein tyrosine phosphatase family protein/NAD(P)/FAD-dependent oxidoreductase [Reinekea blandensis]|uniref:Pyridine nucleotide-disulphide oxidoreductase n=1 Tax=Reinekea blandensis MED297 TaxID=314283 RepID=A4BGG6_9GAMM|nr:bifunctional protein tyrosine phosphatase family protein/NAD(P)/FAD-dependent oxidoreductase [Reinekea blandensis]EAR08772.1 pyridine nucleotide-disulphide oxidoreductase [Reinekea sp. MED297] [Reinekea blandensis MED297]
MDIRQINELFSVSGQLQADDVAVLAKNGIQTLIINRPDGEGADQVSHDEIRVLAEQHGMSVHYLPVISGAVKDEEATQFKELLKSSAQPIHAYCRTGMRSVTLWALAQSQDGVGFESIQNAVARSGYDISGLAGRLTGLARSDAHTPSYDVVIVGAGAAGIATASSIQKRDSRLSIALIDPAEYHYYQPGWTLVGAGVFKPEKTRRSMGSLIPKGVDWIKSAVAQFEPEKDQVLLEGCRPVKYRRLVVAAGLKLNWDGIEGLSETLGKNGVTSNYRFDLAPYTWQMVRQLQDGRAVFTQPPMPIKCAGAPQKVMYLSADHWRKQGRLGAMDIQFFNTGPGLFGVADYVPALMDYVKTYGISLNFQHQLVKVDGDAKKAWFKQVGDQARDELVEVGFDMLHVTPPQQAPDFIRSSPLADDAGWVDVDQYSLQHKRYDNIYGVGDVMNAPNAKTAAAARMQAPVVAHNLVESLHEGRQVSQYNGYGSCPLTVERGKIVLAEFGYGGKLLPSFPKWMVNGLKPTRAAWILKERLLPEIYWSLMLKGHEWMIEPSLEDVR